MIPIIYSCSKWKLKPIQISFAKSSEEKYETTYPIIYMGDKYTGKKHLEWNLFKQNSNQQWRKAIDNVKMMHER